MKNNKRVFSLLLIVAIIFSLLVGTLAYLTDRDNGIKDVAIGTLDIQLDTSNLSLLDKEGNNLFNPADGRTLDYTIKNNGNKSADIRETIVVSIYDREGNPIDLSYSNPEFIIYKNSDVELKEGEGWFSLDGTLPAGEYIVSNNAVMWKLVPKLLNGNHELSETEIEDGIDTDSFVSDYMLIFDPYADNQFANAIIRFDFIVEAKQHRNTDSIEWVQIQVKPIIISNGNKLDVVPSINEDTNDYFDENNFIFVDDDDDGIADRFVKADDPDNDGIYEDEAENTYIPVSKNSDNKTVYVEATHNGDGTYTDKNGNLYIPVDTNNDSITDRYVKVNEDTNGDGIYEDIYGNTYIPIYKDSNGYDIYIKVTDNGNGTYTDSFGNIYIQDGDEFIKVTDDNKDGIYEDNKGNQYIPVDTNRDNEADKYVKAEDSNNDGIYEGENGELYIPTGKDSNGNNVYTEVTEDNGVYKDKDGNTYIPVDTDGDGDVDEYINAEDPDGDGVYIDKDGNNYSDSNDDGIFEPSSNSYTSPELANWEYTLMTYPATYSLLPRTSMDAIVLNTYIGSDLEVVVRNSYTIDDVVYTNIILGDPENYSGPFRNNQNITAIILEEGVILPENSSGLFYGLSNLKSFDMTKANISLVNDMSYMFYNCSELIKIDLSSWQTNNITNMKQMLYGCSNLTTLDISGFDLSSLNAANTGTNSDVYQMFTGSAVSTLKVKDGIAYNYCHDEATYKAGLKSNCNITFDNMPTEASKEWTYKVDSTTNTITLKKYIGSKKDIVVHNEYMADGVVYNNVILGVSNAASQEALLPFWDAEYDMPVTNITSITVEPGVQLPAYPADMFSDLELETLILAGVDTSKVKSLSGIFSNSGASYIDVSGWDTSKVTDFSHCFGHLLDTNTNLTTIIGIESWDMSSAVYLFGMFQGCEALTTLDISGWDFSNLDTTLVGEDNSQVEWMFKDTGLTELKVKDSLAYMFCTETKYYAKLSKGCNVWYE